MKPSELFDGDFLCVPKNSNLTRTAERLLGLLCFTSDEDGTVLTTTATEASELKVSPSAIRKAKRELRAAGWMSGENLTPKRRSYSSAQDIDGRSYSSARAVPQFRPTTSIEYLEKSKACARDANPDEAETETKTESEGIAFLDGVEEEEMIETETADRECDEFEKALELRLDEIEQSPGGFRTSRRRTEGWLRDLWRKNPQKRIEEAERLMTRMDKRAAKDASKQAEERRKAKERRYFSECTRIREDGKAKLERFLAFQASLSSSEIDAIESKAEELAGGRHYRKKVAFLKERRRLIEHAMGYTQDVRA